MALTLINDNKAPRYTALSTDISSSKIAGLTYVGALVYILDTGVTYIVSDGAGTLVAYSQPVGAITGSVSITGTPTVALTGSEAHIGEVGGKTIVVTATPGLSVAGAYVTGDYVGTSTLPMTFTASRVALGSGIVHSAALIDYAKQSVQTELWLFDASVTTPNDNAVWDISDGDALKLVGVINFDTYYACTSNSVATVTNVGIAYRSTSSTSLYGCLVTRGSPTYTTGDISVRLGILQD